MTEGARISLERSSSELRIKKRGETVQLRRTHILGSVGKKDRHSKVYTSKGPRDRRVRLSAPTAIQFYDVQDRLGYDRPSKAVDWLMEKAKTAIDALAELPTQGEQSLQNPHLCNEQLETVNQQDLNGSGLFQIPVSIALSSVHFQNSPAEPNLEEISHTQYPYLSLQSFQEPILGHHRSAVPSAYQTINSASSPMVFDAAYAHWPRSLPVEMSQSQKMMDWNSDMGNGIRGLVFDSLPLPLQEPVLRQNQIFSEREPLQSIHSALISTWMNPPPVSTTKNEHTMIAPNESPGIALASIPAHLHGEDGEQNPICNSQLSATYC